jgi:hypothetical protein
MSRSAARRPTWTPSSDHRVPDRTSRRALLRRSRSQRREPLHVQGFHPLIPSLSASPLSTCQRREELLQGVAGEVAAWHAPLVILFEQRHPGEGGSGPAAGRRLTGTRCVGPSRPRRPRRPSTDAASWTSITHRGALHILRSIMIITTSYRQSGGFRRRERDRKTAEARPQMRTGEPAYSAVMSRSDPTAVLAEMKRTEALLRDARSVLRRVDALADRTCSWAQATWPGPHEDAPSRRLGGRLHQRQERKPVRGGFRRTRTG